MAQLDISLAAKVASACAQARTAQAVSSTLRETGTTGSFWVILAETLSRKDTSGSGTVNGSDPVMGGRPECGQGRCPPGLRPIFEAAARETGLPVALLEAVAEAESGFNPRAVSPAGAAGLMQLMPSTARALGVTDVFDPWQNVLAGARYLRGLLDRFGSLELALAAYNAGPGAVEKWGGVPRYRETRSYVSKILASLGRDPGGAPPCSAVPATKNAVWVWSR